VFRGESHRLAGVMAVGGEVWVVSVPFALLEKCRAINAARIRPIIINVIMCSELIEPKSRFISPSRKLAEVHRTPHARRAPT